MDRSHVVRTVAGIAAGVVALYLALFHLADARKTLEELARANATWLLAAGACEILWFTACVEGWRTTFRPLNARPSRLDLFLLYCLKLMVNNLLSAGRVLGDAARICYGARLGWPLATLVSTVAADLVLGNAGYLLVILAGCIVACYRVEVPLQLVMLNVAGAVGVVGLWSMLASERTCREAYEVIRRVIEGLTRRLGESPEAIDGLATATVRVFRAREARVALLEYTAGWAARVLRLCCVTWAVWPAASLLVPVVASVVIRGSAVVSVSPGGLGIVEGITTGVLTALGADPSRVMAILLLDRVYSFVLPVVLGAVSVPLLERRIERG